MRPYVMELLVARCSSSGMATSLITSQIKEQQPGSSEARRALRACVGGISE
jgi:hypothetical protein